MNRYQLSRNLLTVVGACLVLAACETNPATGSRNETITTSNKSGGHLIVQRSANIATGLILSIDGSKSDLRVGDTYDGYLAPGRHVVSVIPAPNEANQAAASVTLMVENGRTYSFTAARKGDQVVLAKDS